jgi:pimeloyl-ACP methyl ester carboxylesterase
VDFSTCTVVLAHGAGSAADFLAAAFPADRLGVAACGYCDDRTGTVDQVAAALAAAARATEGPVIIGGVSLGAHAAAQVLSHAPSGNVVGGILCMPAWTGAPDRVASMTAAAADALEVLGIDGVLAELDPGDWVTPQLAHAWSLRAEPDLVTEMRAAAGQPAPTRRDLAGIRVPVGIVALSDDPLHPASVAAEWHRAISASGLVTIDRASPAADLAVFADAAGGALRLAQDATRAVRR